MKKVLTAVLTALALCSVTFAGTDVSGVFNGTGGAPLYVGLGFIPDYVRIVNLESVGINQIDWSVNMRALETSGGIMTTGTAAGAITRTALTNQAGIMVYRGGDIVASAAAATNYLVRDATDERASGTGAAVTKWTLDNAALRAGHFDATPSSTYVGEGSRICIGSLGDAKWYTIISASSPTTPTNVVLSEAAPSGDIVALRPMYDFKNPSAGVDMPAGFIIYDSSGANISGNKILIEAGTYDAKQ